MAEWKVIHKDGVPHGNGHRFISSGALVVDANDIESALATAYDYLTRVGKAIRFISTEGADRDKLQSLLGSSFNLNSSAGMGNTWIASCVQHAPAVSGKVIKGL
jgi:hypothetical protein